MELEAERKLELGTESGKELEGVVGIGGSKSPVVWPRRNRRARRQRRPDIILRSYLEPLASAQSQGASYSAQRGFPHIQFVGRGSCRGACDHPRRVRTPRN